MFAGGVAVNCVVIYGGFIDSSYQNRTYDQLLFQRYRTHKNQNLYFDL